MKKILCVLVFATAVMANDPNIMSQWRLDETWGQKAYDSENFYNLDIKGTLTDDSYSDGVFGGGFHFDGASNYLVIGSGTVPSFGGMRDRTLSFWVKFDALDRIQYLFNNYPNTYKSCLVMVNGTLIMQFLNTYGDTTSAGDVRATPGFVTDQWYHMAYVVRDTEDGKCTMELYLNGAPLLSKTGIDRDISGYTYWASFGANAANIGGQNYFAGSMDDIRIYNNGMNSTAAAALYSEQVAPVEVADSDMMTHMCFEETKGIIARSSDGLNHGVFLRGFNSTALPSVDGIYGKALDLDGVAMAGIMSDIRSYGPFQNKTMAMWIAPQRKTVTEFLWSMRNGGDNGTFKCYFLHDKGVIKIAFAEGYTASYTVPAPADPNAPDWQHVAMVLRNTDSDGLSACDLYVNGLLIGTKTGIARHVGASWYGASFMGHAADALVTPGGCFDGLVDDFRIYDRALSGEEIASIITKESTQDTQTAFKPGDDIMLNWQFDQSSGLYVKDTSGADIYGLLKYSPDDDSQWASGVYGNGMWLNGTSCMTLENYNTEYQFGSFSDKTVSVWINPDSLGGDRFLYSMRPGGTSAYIGYILLSNNKVRMQVGLSATRTTIESTTTLVPGNWYHITAVTLPTSDSRCVCALYINGVVEAVGIGAVRDTDNRFFGLTIGGHAGDNPDVGHNVFAGTLDDFKIYDKALTGDEVAAAYAYGQAIYSDIDGNGEAGPEDVVAMTGQWLDTSIAAAGSEYVIENGDFEAYADQAALDAKWQEYYWAPENGSTSSSVLTLLDDTADAFGGSQAMRWDYSTVDTSEALRQFTDILYTFDTPVDMSGYDLMTVMVNKHIGNSSEDALYVKFLNGGVAVTDIKAQALFTRGQGGTSQPVGWSQWVIDLNMLQYPTAVGSVADLTDVQGILFGCYTSPNGGTMPGGSGTIDIDDITFINIPTCGDGLAADVDGDCVVDLADFSILSSEWLTSNN